MTENHTTPMFSEIHTKQSVNEENSSLFLNSTCRKAKTMVETSSLRTLEIMPRNLNVSIRSWIPSQYWFILHFLCQDML